MANAGAKADRSFRRKMPLWLGGINMSAPPHLIADVELTDSVNMWVTPFGRLATRPGCKPMLSDPLPGSVTGSGYFQPEDTLVVSCSNKHLYMIPKSGDLVTAVDLGELSGASLDVSMQMFNGKLYVASGGPLQVYDGEVLATAPHDTESVPPPVQASFLAVRANRLWCGEEETDIVWFSGVEDATDWGRASEAPESSMLNGGRFGVDRRDGDRLSGLANFHDNLIVFKDGHRNTIHRVTGRTSGEFSLNQIAEGLSAVANRAIVNADSDVFFMGQSGVYSLRIVDELGNVEATPISMRLQQFYDRYDGDLRSGCFSPKHGMFFFTIGDRGYSEGNGYSFGHVLVYNRGLGAWWRWMFPWTVTHVIAARGDVIFASLAPGADEGSEAGQLYRLEQDHYRDDDTAITAMVSSKAYEFGASCEQIMVDVMFLAGKITSPGGIFLEPRMDYGTGYEATLTFQVDDIFGGMSMWDDASWDNPKFSWDRTGVFRRQAKIGKIADNMQFVLIFTASAELYDVAVDGSVKSNRRWDWSDE